MSQMSTSETAPFLFTGLGHLENSAKDFSSEGLANFNGGPGSKKKKKRRHR